MNLVPIKKIVFGKAQTRLSLELKKILQLSSSENNPSKSLSSDVSLRVSTVDKVSHILADVYHTNLHSVDFDLQDELEMQNWVKGVSQDFSNKWITGELLD